MRTPKTERGADCSACSDGVPRSAVRRNPVTDEWLHADDERMTGRQKRWEIWRHVIGVAVCLAMGWAGIVQGWRIPIVADATYGFHEFGHLMTWFLDDTYRAMMGSLFQVLIPLGLAGYFLLFQRDALGVSLMLAWGAVSTHETAAYVGDATLRTIQISQFHVDHDWAIALTALDRLSAADELAWVLQAAALVFMLLAMGVSAWGAVSATFETQQADENAEVYLHRAPARAREGYDEWARSQAEVPVHERLP